MLVGVVYRRHSVSLQVEQQEKAVSKEHPHPHPFVTDNYNLVESNLLS